MIFDSLKKGAIDQVVKIMENLSDSDRIPFSEIKGTMPSHLKLAFAKYLDGRLGKEKIVRIGGKYMINTFFPPFPNTFLLIEICESFSFSL